MQIFADIAVSIVSVIVVAAYGWSVRGHFASPKTPPGAWGISALVTISTLLLLGLVWMVEQPFPALLAGLALELLSAALFIAAVVASRQAQLRFAFDPQHPHGLVRGGPYRVVRHPFYVSYIMFWTGWTIAAWSPIAIFIPPAFVLTYWLAARMEERNFAASALAPHYQTYKEDVGFFFPRLGRR